MIAVQGGIREDTPNEEKSVNVSLGVKCRESGECGQLPEEAGGTGMRLRRSPAGPQEKGGADEGLVGVMDVAKDGIEEDSVKGALDGSKRGSLRGQ